MPFHFFLPYEKMYEEENNGVLVETVGTAIRAFREE
jgi:hypothetical protein